MKRSEAILIRKHIENAVQSLSDDAALEVVTLYPELEEGKHYEAGTRVRSGGVLYTVLHPHTWQEDWIPCDSPSLFATVLAPFEDVIPEWVQPESTNGYSVGDKVRYDGKVWESTMDNNVWSPDIYGWTEVDG